VYLDTMNQNNHILSRRGWIAPDLNPAAFLAGFTSDNGNNDTGFSNTRFDEIMLKLGPETADPAERLTLMHETEAFLLQSAAVIPLYTYNSKHLV
jgi:oligopeptide transport system substrate-binding protein